MLLDVIQSTAVATPAPAAGAAAPRPIAASSAIWSGPWTGDRIKAGRRRLSSWH